ncbi:MAG: alpha-tubulin suppressor-like RCC1 family protein [Flavobacteriales bacterium]|jgi:alpha-tubulin suppressor-like RCC1 family protein
MNKFRLIYLILVTNFNSFAQNSMVGDGFGGRHWYSPTNYGVGSYSAYSICYDDSSQLYGWGDNDNNQLGFGFGSTGVSVPTPIPNMSNVLYFSAGYNMGAIKNDGSGWVWGNNTNPIQIISNSYFVDASSYNISFVKNDGTVWSVGDNLLGQFGDGTNNTPTNFLTTPGQMAGISNAVRVSNNRFSTIVLLDDSTLVSTGDNSNGYLGLGASISTTNIPLPIIGIPKIVDLKSNAVQTIALAADGSVYYWGYNFITNVNTSTPILLSNLSNIVVISGCDDGFHFLALDSSKNCYGWGNTPATFGSTAVTINQPTLVATEVVDIMAGETF